MLLEGVKKAPLSSEEDFLKKLDEMATQLASKQLFHSKLMHDRQVCLDRNHARVWISHSEYNRSYIQSLTFDILNVSLNHEWQELTDENLKTFASLQNVHTKESRKVNKRNIEELKVTKYCSLLAIGMENCCPEAASQCWQADSGELPPRRVWESAEAAL